jgi:hypothetical protein
MVRTQRTRRTATQTVGAALAQHNDERKIIMLYFIKGDSQENWGAMKLTLTKGANVSRVIWQNSQDGWTCVGAKEFNAWRKKFSKLSIENCRPLPDNLEHIGMGLDCVECGNSTSWLPCWNCGGEGGWDGVDLMAEDPLWYDEDDHRNCDECKGKGGWNYCTECRKIVKVKKDDQYHSSGHMEPSYPENEVRSEQ